MTDADEPELFGDFYDVLGRCTNDELDPIVGILAREPLSLLKISRAFEIHHPDHVRYADEIGDEMYRFALKALGRSDGKRPSYEDMVGGLCKRIKIPTATNDVDENETNLLNTFATRHLSSLPSAGRQRLVDDACVAGSKAAASSIFSDEWPSFAATLLQFIYLKGKLAEEGRLKKSSSGAIEVATSGVPAPIGENENALVVQTKDGDSVLSLAMLPDDGAEGWRAPESSRKILNIITPMLKAAQPFFSAEQVLAGGNYVRVVLPPGGAISFSEKLGHYVGVAKGYKGMVPLDPVSAASLATPLALLTLASAIAEQKKLENIEKSLDEIKASLDDVSKFQQNERRSVLTGSIRYFQQVSHSVLTGELATEVLHEIERHEVELVRVQEHLIRDLRDRIAALGTIKKGTLASAKYVKAIEEVQADLARLYDEVLLCIRARACGYQLLCAYPGRDAGKRARFVDISKALEAFSPTGDTTLSMDQILREKLNAVSSYESKAPLLASENAIFKRTAYESSAILEGLKFAIREPSEETLPISIDLKVQDGQAVAMRIA